MFRERSESWLLNNSHTFLAIFVRPRTAPRRPKTAPGRPQDSPKTPPRLPQDATKTAQEQQEHTILKNERFLVPKTDGNPTPSLDFQGLWPILVQLLVPSLRSGTLKNISSKLKDQKVNSQARWRVRSSAAHWIICVMSYLLSAMSYLFIVMCDISFFLVRLVSKSKKFKKIEND